MNILVCPSDRFGLEPNAKHIKMTNIYLITALRTTPDKAKTGVMCIENNIRKVVEIAKKSEVTDYLSSNETQCWFIQNGKWVKHHPDVGGVARYDYLLWEQGKINQIYNDYNVEEMYSLYNYVNENAQWILSINKGQVLASLSGVSFDSIRQIKPYIKVDHKKFAAKTVKPSHNSISLLKDIVDEYANMNLIMGKMEDKDHPVVKQYLEHGEHVDDKGYKVTKEKLLVTIKGKWEECIYALRFKAKARNVCKEKGRYAISMQNARVILDDDIKYFSLGYLSKSTTLFDILYEKNDYVKSCVDEFIKQNEGVEATNFHQVFGYNLQDNQSLLKAFSDIDIELNVNGEWVKFDITNYRKQSELQLKHINNNKYIKSESVSEVSEKRDKMEFCEDFYGTSSLWGYLMHPLHLYGTCLDTEPCYSFWMTWCETNKVRFKH